MSPLRGTPLPEGFEYGLSDELLRDPISGLIPGDPRGVSRDTVVLTIYEPYRSWWGGWRARLSIEVVKPAPDRRSVGLVMPLLRTTVAVPPGLHWPTTTVVLGKDA